MYGDVKEMRESVYGRRRRGSEDFETSAGVMGRGDSVREGIRGRGKRRVDKAEGVASASSKPKLSAFAAT